MVNGGVFDSLSIVIESTVISISPVGIVVFLLERSVTVPIT